MNRTALCIKMLQTLYGRKDYVSRNEMAEILETNPRNISEFKRELETAGYIIDSTPGKYGGYKLMEGNIFPSLALDDKEKRSVQEALDYLKNDKQFIYYDSFFEAMSKMNAKLRNISNKSETLYMHQNSSLSEKEKKMIDDITYAKQNNLTITFSYCSLKDTNFVVRKIEPYEILSNTDGIYVLGYDRSLNKSREYKFFKINDRRMKSVNILNQSFHRDSDFQIQECMGKNSLFKDSYEVEMNVYNLQARLLNEKGLDNIIEKKDIKNGIYVHFVMESKYQLIQFILSLGKDCEVLSPSSLIEEVKEECHNMLSYYE